ncbi:MAG TPA: hypothetical protein PK135_14090, partial [Arenimonas sp.]|nr:hypothetical protein [Arenimonas sp.]
MKRSKSSKASQNATKETWPPAKWPGESKETGETPYKQRRQRAAEAAGLTLCKCGGLLYNISGRQVCGDCG